MKRLLLALVVCCLILAQETVDQAAIARIRSEEAEHSQIMHTLHMLTDRYGPRVTGTPNHEAAARWVVDQMTQWGLKNGHLEPWDFGHPGWLNLSAAGYIVAPVRENLKFEVLAWTPSTNGAAAGSAIQLMPPQGPPPPSITTSDAAAPRGSRGAAIRLGPTKDEMDQW